MKKSYFMKKSYLYISFFVFLVFLVFLIVLVFVSKNKNSEEVKNLETEIKLVSGDSMSPLIKDGQKLKYIKWYYSFREAKVWDLVNYNFASKFEFIKQVKATDKDDVKISWDNLVINWKPMKNSAWESYSFTEAELNLLKLYISKENKLPKWSVFIFWDNISSSKDSRKFWAVSQKDFLGRLEIIKK